MFKRPCRAHEVVEAMSITESEANFAARATALQLDKAVLDKFVSAGINCMSKFAFMSAHITGNGDEKPFVTAVESVIGRPATIAEMSVLRRLLHESYNLTVSELQTQVDRTDESAPRKLAAPDRADRLAAQQARLTGISIKGVLMPSHKLVDKCCQIYEDNCLQYLPLHHCTDHDSAVRSHKDKDDKTFSVDSAGRVTLKSSQDKLECDVSNELLVKHALTRRALGLDQAGVLSFSLHEEWSDALLTARYREAPDGYSRVTLQLTASCSSLPRT